MFSAREAAALGGVTIRGVNKAIEQGVIEATKVGRQTAIPDTELAPLALLDEVSKSLRLALDQKRQIRNWLAHLPITQLEKPEQFELAPALMVFVNEQVAERVREAVRYAELREKYIDSDPETKGGVPVIRGTRVTASAVAARLDAGDTIESLMEDYPDVPGEALEVAATYARTHPRRGRPPRPSRPVGR
ncbi:MAG: DUF433 domain-containing protein [Actinomycetota bacterium]|nr:DUF433 domain-containing protein [Actinomycetota bacterium]